MDVSAGAGDVMVRRRKSAGAGGLTVPAGQQWLVTQVWAIDSHLDAKRGALGFQSLRRCPVLGAPMLRHFLLKR